mgnify:CR=1 FL=1
MKEQQETIANLQAEIEALKGKLAADTKETTWALMVYKHPQERDPAAKIGLYEFASAPMKDDMLNMAYELDGEKRLARYVVLGRTWDYNVEEIEGGEQLTFNGLVVVVCHPEDLEVRRQPLIAKRPGLIIP